MADSNERSWNLLEIAEKLQGALDPAAAQIAIAAFQQEQETWREAEATKEELGRFHTIIDEYNYVLAMAKAFPESPAPVDDLAWKMVKYMREVKDTAPSSELDAKMRVASAYVMATTQAVHGDEPAALEILEEPAGYGYDINDVWALLKGYYEEQKGIYTWDSDNQEQDIVEYMMSNYFWETQPDELLLEQPSIFREMRQELMDKGFKFVMEYTIEGYEEGDEKCIIRLT